MALMLPALTPLVASPVPVTRATVGMETPVKVSNSHDLDWHIDSVAIPDINECTSDTGNCDTNAGCTNTPGSFTCACNQGYSGDGAICVGK